MGRTTGESRASRRELSQSAAGRFCLAGQDLFQPLGPHHTHFVFFRIIVLLLERTVCAGSKRDPSRTSYRDPARVLPLSLVTSTPEAALSVALHPRLWEWSGCRWLTRITERSE